MARAALRWRFAFIKYLEMFIMNYTRYKRVITCLDDKTVEMHKYINAAKRASRKLQASGNTVTVIRDAQGRK
jgi:hypothetical protein